MAYSMQETSSSFVQRQWTDHQAKAVAIVATPTLKLPWYQREPPEDWPNSGQALLADGSAIFLTGLVVLAAYAGCFHNSLSSLFH